MHGWIREVLEYDLGKIARNINLLIIFAYLLFTFGVSVYLFFFSPVSQTLLVFLRPLVSLEGGTKTIVCFVALIPYLLVWMFFYAGMIWWIFWGDQFGEGRATVLNTARLLLVVVAPWLDGILGADFNRVALLVAGEGILGMLLSVPTLFRFMASEMIGFSLGEFLGYLRELVPVIIAVAAFVPMLVDAFRFGIVRDPLNDIMWYIWLILGSLGAMRSFRGGLSGR